METFVQLQEICLNATMSRGVSKISHSAVPTDPPHPPHLSHFLIQEKLIHHKLRLMALLTQKAENLATSQGCWQVHTHTGFNSWRSSCNGQMEEEVFVCLPVCNAHNLLLQFSLFPLISWVFFHHFNGFCVCTGQLSSLMHTGILLSICLACWITYCRGERNVRCWCVCRHWFASEGSFFCPAPPAYLLAFPTSQSGFLCCSSQGTWTASPPPSSAHLIGIINWSTRL